MAKRNNQTIAGQSPSVGRFFPKWAARVVWSVVACQTVGGVAAEELSRPNILFIFADDWGRVASCYREADGEPGISFGVSTPNIDAVARRGVLFRHAFVNAPSCTPCRSALLSGQYFWRTGRGAILQGARWDESIPVWPLALRDAGYFIGKSYKVWSPGVPADAPYGGQQYAFEQHGRRFNQFSQNVTRLVAAGKRVEDAKNEILAEIRANFRHFLDACPSGKPFCYWFGPTNVHRAWQKGSGKALWNIDPEQFRGHLPPFLPDVPEVREDWADYLGEVQALDAAVGVLLEELGQRRLLDRTLVIISGDHGPPGFLRGKCNLYDFGTRVPLIIAGPGVPGPRIVDDMVNLPDLAPTLLEVAGLRPPEVMTGRSLWPVLRSERQGLVDPQRTWVLTGRERHVEMARQGYLPYPQRAIRTLDHLLIVNFKPDRYPMGDPYRLGTDQEPSFDEIASRTFVTLADDDASPTKAWVVTHRHDPQFRVYYERAYEKRPRVELYDIRRDPYQLENLAEKPEYAELRRQLEEQLLAELKRTGDPRMIDDGRYFETPPLAGPLPEDVPKPNRSR
ncbi:MAG: sulfatase [Pirellulaceae bacterium]|nr:MAG: sulfatase [Pirellulaceae bacterium]